MYENIESAAREAAKELLDKASWRAGDLIIIGCSSSEIIGENIGKAGNPEAARAVFRGIWPLLEENGLFLAAQCCEHLNRALIIEREAALRHGCEPVSVRPYPEAGGSFATVAFDGMRNPVAVECIRAVAGMDIGGTLIGMHLKPVAVPLRLSVKSIGSAAVSAAWTRPKLIGGQRARYE